LSKKNSQNKKENYADKDKKNILEESNNRSTRSRRGAKVEILNEPSLKISNKKKAKKPLVLKKAQKKLELTPQKLLTSSDKKSSLSILSPQKINSSQKKINSKSPPSSKISESKSKQSTPTFQKINQEKSAEKSSQSARFNSSSRKMVSSPKSDKKLNITPEKISRRGNQEKKSSEFRIDDATPEKVPKGTRMGREETSKSHSFGTEQRSRSKSKSGSLSKTFNNKKSNEKVTSPSKFNLTPMKPKSKSPSKGSRLLNEIIIPSSPAEKNQQN